MGLPNKLTVLRTRMIPILILVVRLPLDWGQLNIEDATLVVTQLVGTVIFALASITNWLDGKIARIRGPVTNFGKFADPLIDKTLVMTAFIVLTDQEKAPGWVVAIVVYRKLAVTGLCLLPVEHEEAVAAAWPGKVRTATQTVVIILLFIDNIPFNLISISIDQTMLYVCLIFTIYSSADYFIKSNGVFGRSMWVLFCGWSDSSVLDKVRII